MAVITMSLTTGCGDEAGRARADDGVRPEPRDREKHAYTNRLARETSPYLLQHAHNPVSWYPWGEEAFAKARREHKPIFLSIGYSACHWCHVMERESFENKDVAAILNAEFVSIKVDREERPDVDRIYMTAVQMMTGSGGWPLTVFLTPDLEPFFGGTYFPTKDRFGRPGFKSLLTQLAGLWEDQRPEIRKRAADAARAISQHLESSAAGRADADDPGAAVRKAVRALAYSYDQKWGGFGSQPKFPPSGTLGLLMRRYEATHDDSLLRMVTHTLDRMSCGGMYDQLGGGFHRYSVDRKWLVPHFEKMLYDNALLAGQYLEAYRLTKRPLYRRIAVETLDYVIRDMTNPSGGFHSAEDADSEGEEGKFYVWTREEIDAALGSDAGLFADYYGVTATGNFEGKNILHTGVSIEELARARNTAPKDVETRLDELRAKLLETRSARIRPGKDDKILASWNGLMISSFAKGYRILGEKRFLETALEAARFVKMRMMDKSGSRLFRTYRKGEARIPAYLDDYASMANAFIDIHEASLDPGWLSDAERLTKEMIGLFWDEQGHGFYFTSGQHKNLLARAKPYSDSSVPSGNSTAAVVLLRLSELRNRQDYGLRAIQTVRAAVRTVGDYPQAYPFMLSAADMLANPDTFGGCQIKNGRVVCRDPK